MWQALRYSAVCCAITLSLGCDSVTGPTALSVDSVVSPLTGGPFPASGNVVGTTVEITGALGSPDPCYSFAGRATLRSDTLHVRLLATPSAEACVQIIGAWQYSVSVRDVPAGEWNVRLDYELRGTGPTQTLYSGRHRVGAQP